MAGLPKPSYAVMAACEVAADRETAASPTESRFKIWLWVFMLDNVIRVLKMYDFTEAQHGRSGSDGIQSSVRVDS